MMNMVEPRGPADLDGVERTDSTQDGELTTLIRRWMAAGTRVQERVRRESVLQIAPDPEDVAPAPDEPAPGGPETTYVVGTPLADDPLADDPLADASLADDPLADDLLADDPLEDASEVALPACEELRPLRVPALPQRATGAETEQVHRVALLIDARRVSADVATVLLARLGQRGSVNVCRAYADWSRSELGDWVGQMRREGLHSFHHFSDQDDQALVAMAIDAVDIARDAAVDEVVIAGDLTSALPLVHRLHAAGVRVVAVGPGHTPHDVRAACHEFIDTASIDGEPMVPAGRHRA